VGVAKSVFDRACALKLVKLLVCLVCLVDFVGLILVTESSSKSLVFEVFCLSWIRCCSTVYFGTIYLSKQCIYSVYLYSEIILLLFILPFLSAFETSCWELLNLLMLLGELNYSNMFLSELCCNSSYYCVLISAA